MSIEFQWDKDKACLNLKKHGISFEQAATSFYDTLSITIVDCGHSVDEGRYVLLGLSNQNRLLVVAHTDRDGAIRIISARSATNKERKYYEATR